MDGNQEIPPPSPGESNAIGSLGSALFQLRCSVSSSTQSNTSTTLSSSTATSLFKKRPSSSSSTLSLPVLPLSVSASSSSTPLACGGDAGRGRELGEDWQCQLSSLRERNAVMFDNDMISDVTFLVGDDDDDDDDPCVLIPAHKYVLSISSPAFYAMFHGGLSHGGEEQPIRISDIHPACFKTMLRYMYTDEVHLTSDTALGTLYSAKKYLMPALARECVEYLERSLTAENACLYLCQSRMFGEQGLASKCWQIIDAQAEQALASPAFREVDHQTLDDIIRRDSLVTRELVVFRAVMGWAGAECRRRGLAPTAEHQRAVLGDSLLLLRLPLIDMKQFADTVVASGILTTEETRDLFLYHVASSKPSIPFPTLARRGLPLQRCQRFQASAFRSNQWRYKGRCDSIQFSTDRRLFMAGVSLYGSSNGAAVYSVSVELKTKQATLVRHECKFRSDGSSKTFPISFPSPAPINPSIPHTVSVVLCGQELSFFGQEGMAEVAVGGGEGGAVTFTFQSSQDSTNGTGVQGGQIPEILFYMV